MERSCINNNISNNVYPINFFNKYIGNWVKYGIYACWNLTYLHSNNNMTMRTCGMHQMLLIWITYIF